MGFAVVHCLQQNPPIASNGNNKKKELKLQ